MRESDYILNPETNDLVIRNGDFAVGDPTRDNQALLLLTMKGELKGAPLSTVGLRSFMNDERPQSLLREVRRIMTADGQKIRSLTYTEGRLKLDAFYD